MRRIGLIVVFVAFFSLLTGFFYEGVVVAEDALSAKKKEIEELQQKITELQSQKQTLAQTVTYLNTRIQLAQKEIDATETEILILTDQVEALNSKIEVLDMNLDKLTELLINRVNASYKSASTQPIYYLLTNAGLSDLMKKYKYFKASQQNDRVVIYSLEEAKNNYDAQKKLKEEKQAEVESLQKTLIAKKSSLDQQQKEKEAALTVTRNDEKRFQEQLARALAEIRAIQSIIAGAGQESRVGEVKEGDEIASVIPGASACSSGAHLHLEIAKDKVNLNPADYLSNKSVVWDNSPDGPFGFGGSWRWPINEPVRITQGYGMTFYAATLRYYGGKPHTGIDMVNNDNYDVSAVQGGVLYRGAIACGGGTLRYVRVEHTDGISSYYLHVNY